MSRCAACNKIMTHQELAMNSFSKGKEPNDLCRNCAAIVANPDMAEWIDQDGSDSILFCNEHPLDKSDEEIWDDR